MFVSVCHDCSHGDEIEGQSYCSREAVYSRLTRCLQQKALASFLEHQSVDVLPVKVASNQ